MVVFIGVDQAAGLDGLLDQGFNGGLLDIFKHLNDNLTTALDHAQDGRLFCR